MTDILEWLRTIRSPRAGEAASEIERNRAAIDELVVALKDFVLVFDMYVNGPSAYPAYNKARAAITKHDSTTKEQ